ncbi:MAG: HU family DNA-binding protein [Prevotellaceae bacterium]|jgi:nucleoid DNA-binding protein|nr:HU family DNA-binding protein [Prevotellaceae bacterium]
MNEKINNKEILEQISAKAGVNLSDVENFLDNFQEIFFTAIDNDKLLKISKLGTFQLIWNKPRKSVDVNTGEEIEIAGHYRLNFNADNSFKELLNPDNEGVSAENETPLPLVKLAQQASEIKGILASLQENTPKILPKKPVQTPEKEEIVEKIIEKVEEVVEKAIEKAEEVVEKTIEEIEEKTETLAEPDIEEDEFIKSLKDGQKMEEVKKEIEKTAEEKTEENVKINTEEEEKRNAQRQSAIDFFHRKLETPPEVKANTFVYLDENEADENNENIDEKKSRWWIWLLIVLLLAGSAVAYFFWQPKYWNNVKNFTAEKFEQTKTFTTQLFEKEQDSTIDSTTIATPIAVVDTCQTDSTTIATPITVVDTCQTDSARLTELHTNYVEFITEEIIDKGGRLTLLSEKYYGNKVFWVYIYEANKSVIANPNILKAGQKIKIPKLDKKLINSNDSLCLKYAQKLHNQYVKK